MGCLLNGHCNEYIISGYFCPFRSKIIATEERRPESEVEKFLLSLRVSYQYFELRGHVISLRRTTEELIWWRVFPFQDESRYNEDIFGITLRTAEVQNKSRQSALIRLSSHLST